MVTRRQRPKGRLETRTIQIRVGSLPSLYLHIERQRFAKKLGPVEQVWISTGSKSGTEMDDALHRVSRRINAHLQIKEVFLVSAEQRRREHAGVLPAPVYDPHAWQSHD